MVYHWVRAISSMAHIATLIQPVRVKAFLGGRNKTDAADAKAISGALIHPTTTFIRAKTIEQQDIDHLLDRRQRLNGKVEMKNMRDKFFGYKLHSI